MSNVTVSCCNDVTCEGLALLQARTDVFDDKQRSEDDFFQYVAKSYRYFLAGDDYQSQAVDDEIAQEAEDRAEEIRQRNQELQQVSLCFNSLASDKSQRSCFM